MVFSLMNREIHTTVPGVKNRAEAEETAGCVDLPPIPPEHLAKLRELYENDFRRTNPGFRGHCLNSSLLHSSE